MSRHMPHLFPWAGSQPPHRGRSLIVTALILLGGMGLLAITSSLSSSSSEAGRYEDEAAQIERRLVVSPQDSELLLLLAAARYHVATEMIKGGSQRTSREVIRPSRQASEAWLKYLDVASSPNPSAAKAMESVLVSLAEAAPNTTGYREAMRNAAKASEIAAEQAPNIDALMTLAYYRDFAFDWNDADAAGKEALALVRTRSEAEEIGHALGEYQRQAREIKRQLTGSKKGTRDAGLE